MVRSSIYVRGEVHIRAINQSISKDVNCEEHEYIIIFRLLIIKLVNTTVRQNLEASRKSVQTWRKLTPSATTCFLFLDNLNFEKLFLHRTVRMIRL